MLGNDADGLLSYFGERHAQISNGWGTGVGAVVETVVGYLDVALGIVTLDRVGGKSSSNRLEPIHHACNGSRQLKGSDVDRVRHKDLRRIQHGIGVGVSLRFFECRRTDVVFPPRLGVCVRCDSFGGTSGILFGLFLFGFDPLVHFHRPFQF